MNNIEIIETGFNGLCEAYTQGVVKFKPCRLYSDLLVHMDIPEENRHRFTYVTLNDSKEIIAMCAFILSQETGTNDVGWVVRDDQRGKGIGKLTVARAFDEFKNGVKSAGAKGAVIGATVDEGNAASISIARKFIGGEEIIQKSDGTTIYSYLNHFQF